jgi:hypothetical protein
MLSFFFYQAQSLFLQKATAVHLANVINPWMATL